MGADQIGYLYKGPARLSRSRRTMHTAATRAQHVLQALRELRATGAIPARLPSALRHLGHSNVEEVLQAVDALPEPGIAIQNLLDWWSGGARDTATRPDPDDPKVLIGFAGDRTWGDEPDGVGYRTFRDALTLDILRPFGIR